MKTNNLYAQLSVGQGPAGPVGPQGPKGDKGDKGETGPVGPQGPKGDKGERGARGERGLTGPTGLQGERGAQGPEGQRGPQGIQGPKGDKGDKGPKGDKGDTGAQGPKGDRGEKGEKGDSGGVMPADMVDYMGNQHESLKAKNDADVDWLLGEVNTVHYDGQHITATDTIEGRAKSAILKGNTLVNLLNDYNSGQYRSSLVGETDFVTFFNMNDKKVYFDTANEDGSYKKSIVINPYSVYTKQFSPTDKFRLINLNDGHGWTSENYAECKVVMLKGDYTNVDIPYFEGMTSVKAPVLKATGKNLFDMNAIVKADFELNKYQNSYYGKEFVLQPNTTYTIKAYLQEEITNTSVWTVFNIINNNSVLEVINIDKTGTSNTNRMITMTFTTNSTGKVGYSIYCHYNSEVSWLGNLPFNIQLEKGSVATPYEPYKSNTLSTPEDLELRGIGEVKDELNVATGELTQRVGEIVLDGSENWRLNKSLGDGSFYQFVVSIVQAKKVAQQLVVCDKLVSAPNESINNRIWIYDGTTMVIHSSCRNVDEMKTWLTQNPLTVQYELATESIKTVDLSDNHVYSYQETTHYSFEPKDNSLIPTLSLDVPTKLNALVARQKDTIQELTQENESLKAAQQILLNSQLSFYESLVSTIPALMPVEGQVNIPDFIQDLYRLKNNQK